MTATTPPITPQITAVLAPSDSETMSEDVSLVTSNSCIPKTDEVSEIEANGVFIYVGLDPLTEPFKKAGITNEAGWIETDQEMRTKIPGVYAIGDVREKTLRQITTAVGEGGIAGQQVFNYIEELK